ncbi:MAG: N-acetyl-gamma-glutamyl-phosphate reductase [Pseudomonadota bacterium]
MSTGSPARIFIDGQAGTTGLQITQRLAARRDVELLTLEDAQRKDPASRRDAMAAADVTLLCLPDSAVAEAVALAPQDARILDASSVHRVHDDWVYGLPELGATQRERLRTARRVSNPGCYPQGLILLLRPLFAAGLLRPAQARIYQAVSGYSGGGRSMIEHFEAQPPGAPLPTRSYALDLTHKHVPEMQRYTGLTHAPLFLPSVGHFRQGMTGFVPLFASDFERSTSVAELTTLLGAHYRDEPFVHVIAVNAEDPREAGFLDPTHRNNSNDIDLMVFGNEQQYLLCARYDNLGKGAAGAAVQNLNLMLGRSETDGLAPPGE